MVRLNNNITIRHENRTGKIITVGFDETYKVIGIKPGYRPINGSGGRRVYLVEVFFTDKPSYPIGYFSGRDSRDLAIQILLEASKGDEITFSHKDFFRYSPLTAIQKVRIRNKYSLATVIGKTIERLQIEQEVSHPTAVQMFLVKYNNNRFTKITLNGLHIFRILNREAPLDLSSVQLALDLRLILDPPKSVPDNINPVDFWVVLTKKHFNEK